MKRIGIISDTHGYLDEAVFQHFKDCDEIWHAGDFGNDTLAEQLRELPVLCGSAVNGVVSSPQRLQRFRRENIFHLNLSYATLSYIRYHTS